MVSAPGRGPDQFPRNSYPYKLKMNVVTKKQHYTARGGDRVIVAWVQPTGITSFTVGCTDPTNGSPVPARARHTAKFFAAGRMAGSALSRNLRN